MNREIKFKIWLWSDKETREGAWMDLWDPMKYPDSSMYGESLTSLGFTLEDCPKEEFEVCQYTGLKDKNGKEIYEGDIVKVSPLGWEKPNEIITKVLFQEGMFGIKTLIEYKTNYMLKLTVFDTEIVGNIYENPELLKR